MNADSSKYRTLGVLAALAAGAAWGISFLAPRALESTEASTLAFFRFLFFGVSSAIALGWARLKPLRTMPRLTGADVFRALVLGSAGYSVYYFLLASGVKGAGVSFAVGVIGLLPLTILVASTPPRKWAKLVVPMFLIAAGAMMIAWDLYHRGEESHVTGDRTLGALACLGALVLWTYFAVANARFLRRHPDWRALDWAGVIGVASAVVSVALFFATERSDALEVFRSGIQDARLLVWSGFMGIAGAWGATAMWNFASRHLPGAWLGQLLVFESIFGLLFGFLYEGRGPRLWEGGAVLALLLGVVSGLFVLGRQDE